MNSILAISLIIFSLSVKASVEKNQPLQPEGVVNQTMSTSNGQKGFLPFLSFGAGYGDSAGSDNDKAEGAPSSLKLLGSYITPSERGVFDFGFGIQNHNFVHTLVKDKAISTGVLEIAARYQFKNHWQLGIVYDHAFNVGENFYANQADVLFGGGQMMRQFAMNQNLQGRLGGRFVNGINIRKEVFNMIMFDVQLSIPSF